MVSEILYVWMWLLACVQFTICAIERDKTYDRPAMVPDRVRVYWRRVGKEVRAGRQDTGRGRERESAGDETVWKKWCVCAVSQRAWTGQLAREPLHACLWQLTLSLRQETVNTTALTPQLCNADYIITHHTHFNSFSASFDIRHVKRSNL